MKNWFKVFFLFSLLGLLVYSNSLNNKFMMDDDIFLNDPLMSSTKFMLSHWDPYAEQELGVINGGVGVYYRPMHDMALDFYYGTFKHDLWQYHLANLLLLVFAASLMYLLVLKISGNYNLALLTGFFYLIHPINGIVVNYASACVFPFQTIFTLGAILLLWESLKRKNNRVFYFLSLLLSLLTMFWHESGIMTAFYVSTVVVLFRKDPPWTKARYLFPYFLIALAYIVFRLFFVSLNESIFKQIALFHMKLWEYPASLFQIFSWYITQLFYPKGIVMQWATPLLHTHVLWNNVGAFSMLLFFILLFVRFSKEKICQLGLAWILIGFAPACVAAFRRPEAGVLIEPHWFSFSSIGFFILAAYFLLMIIGRAQKVGLVVLLGIVFGWAASCHAYNQLWADQKTYARYWVKEVPNLDLPYYYLAGAYQTQGDIKESRKYFRLALSGSSLDASIYINLGILDASMGDWKGAELNYKKALKIYPLYALAYYDLGNLYVQQGQWKKAEGYYSQALAYDPLYFGARMAFANVCLNHAQYQKAIDLSIRNLEIDNNDTGTLIFLISIYTHQKDLVNIKKYAYRLINSETDPRILALLGNMMGQQGIVDAAIDSYIKAMRMAPNYKYAYWAAGKLLAKCGMVDKAVNIWQMGLSIDPSDQRFKDAITRARGVGSN